MQSVVHVGVTSEGIRTCLQKQFMNQSNSNWESFSGLPIEEMQLHRKMLACNDLSSGPSFVTSWPRDLERGLCFLVSQTG